LVFKSYPSLNSSPSRCYTCLKENPNNQNLLEETDISQYIRGFDCIIDKFRKNLNMQLVLKSQAIVIGKRQLFKDKILEGTFKTT